MCIQWILIIFSLLPMSTSHPLRPTKVACRHKGMGPHTGARSTYQKPHPKENWPSLPSKHHLPVTLQPVVGLTDSSCSMLELDGLDLSRMVFNQDPQQSQAPGVPPFLDMQPLPAAFYMVNCHCPHCRLALKVSRV